MGAAVSLPDGYGELRFRMYVVPGAFRTVQDFYRRLWPGMDFYDFEKSLPRELFDIPAGMKPPDTLLWVISRRPVAESSPADT